VCKECRGKLGLVEPADLPPLARGKDAPAS